MVHLTSCSKSSAEGMHGPNRHWSAGQNNHTDSTPTTSENRSYERKAWGVIKRPGLSATTCRVVKTRNIKNRTEKITCGSCNASPSTLRTMFHATTACTKYFRTLYNTIVHPKYSAYHKSTLSKCSATRRPTTTVSGNSTEGRVVVLVRSL